jgi:sugar transferase (PEP-CTERM/EpsH1 system associated)
MELLFLAHRAPTAPDRGDRIRSFHVLKHLSSRANVHVVAFDEVPAPRPDMPLASWTVVPRTKSRARAVAEALATGRPVSLTAFADLGMTAALARVPRVDATYVFSGQMAQHVPDGFVMDFVDVDSAKFAQLAATATGPKEWLLSREARLLAAFERQTAARASASVFISEAEAALFGQGIAIGNGIDADHFRPDVVSSVNAPARLVVFTGQMDYQPNVDAVVWFVRDVLPKLDATFAIVGRAPTATVRALAGPRVIVTGEVADTRPWIAAASVCVAPLLLARGVQNKVLEAMAMASPVVATPAAAEGIDHRGTIRVAEPAAFADAVAALIHEPGTLGQQARARVLAGYAWGARLAPLERLLALDRKLAA